MDSPYLDLSVEEWLNITHEIVNKHPLSESEIVDAILASWQSIFDSRLGTKGFQIGKDIFPKPQIMGFLLHELIPLELAAKHPDNWRGDTNAADKDLVYVPNDSFSVEVKTSSDRSHIFGNKSYAQGTSKGKKVSLDTTLLLTLKNSLMLKCLVFDSFASAGLIPVTGLDRKLLRVNNHAFQVMLKSTSSSSYIRRNLRTTRVGYMHHVSLAEMP